MSIDPTRLASAASHLSQMQVKEQVSYAVARKSLDATKQQGQAALKLLESAAQVSRQASTPGMGNHVDVTG